MIGEPFPSRQIIKYVVFIYIEIGYNRHVGTVLMVG